MILGYDRQIAYLDRVMARGRLAHAYLFYGPDGAGMLSIAKAMAKALHCPARLETEFPSGNSVSKSIREAGDGCKICAAIDADTHPGVTLLDRAHSLTSKKEALRDIPIDDLREVKRRFSLAAAGDAWRVAIIHDADTMSRDAQVAFLKLLEEPGERALFLLTSDARESVAPTIASRAVAIGFLGGTNPAVDEAMRTAVQRALAAGIPEALALSEKIAGDRAGEAAVVSALVDDLRMRMHAAAMPRERYLLAARIARVLTIATLRETTNVNPRLALDVMLLENVGSAHPRANDNSEER